MKVVSTFIYLYYLLLRLYYHSSMKRCFIEDYCINLYCSILCRKYGISLQADSYFYRQYKMYFPPQAPAVRRCILSQGGSVVVFFFFQSMKINLQIESSYSKWIITSSSWVWYFLQKSSRTQPSDIPGGGAALPERCQGALMGRGTGADVEPPGPCLRWSFMQLQTAKSALGTPAAARHLHKAPWKQISTSSQTSVGSSAHKSKCQLLRCICHITAELLGNPP